MTELEYSEQALQTVMASSVRQRIIARLYESPGTPMWLMRELGYDTHSMISNQLSNLRDIDVVELRVDESTTKGRVYGLTEQGKALVEGIDAIKVGGDE